MPIIRNFYNAIVNRCSNSNPDQNTSTDISQPSTSDTHPPTSEIQAFASTAVESELSNHFTNPTTGVEVVDDKLDNPASDNTPENSDPVKTSVPVMEKKHKSAKKRKIVEQEDSHNESILEEVLSISGKNSEKESSEDSPSKIKKTANGKETPPNESVEPSSSSTEDAIAPNTNEDEDEIPPLSLPEGWRRTTVVRKSGKTAGQIDVYFYGPDGTKLRSRPDVLSYINKNKLELSMQLFDFSKKSLNKVSVVAPAGANDEESKDKSEPKDKSEDDDKNSPEKEPAKKPVVSRSTRGAKKVPPPTKKQDSPKSGKKIAQILAFKKKRSRK